MAVTLADVARVAGVSVATVSRAFRHPERLSERTLQRVLHAASQVEYQVNSPVNGRTDGLVFALIAAETFNPVFSQYISAVDEQAWEGGHRVLLAGTGSDPVREREAIVALRPHADGILLISPRSGADEIYECIGDTPVVVSNGAASEHWPTVLMSSDLGIAQAIEHLAALGHGHVAFAPGPANSWATQDRLAAMTHHTKIRDIRLTVVGNQIPTVQGGLSASAAVAASGATAVIGYNDFIALGLRSGLKALGLRCPDDISIIGVDNGDFAIVSEPPLTSIATNIYESAKRAFSLLRTMVIEEKSIVRVEKRPSQLIVRASTGSAAVSRNTLKSVPAAVTAKDKLLVETS